MLYDFLISLYLPRQRSWQNARLRLKGLVVRIHLDAKNFFSIIFIIQESRVNPILPRHVFYNIFFILFFLRTSFTRCFQNLLFSSFSSLLTLHEISFHFILITQNIEKLLKNHCSLSLSLSLNLANYILSCFSRHFILSALFLELIRN